MGSKTFLTNTLSAIAIIVYLSAPAFSQIKLNGLKQLLEKADTVMVISFFSPIYDLDEQTVNTTLVAPLWLRGKPNPARINEQLILSSAQVQQLSNILSKPGTASRTVFMCYNPHHLIVAIHEKKVSHIELCFECQGFRTSEDIELRQEDITKDKLVAVSAFFKRLGFRYELDVFE